MSESQLSTVEMENISKKWIKILNLEECPISLIFEEELLNSEMRMPAYINWNFKEKSWEIHYYKLVDKKTIIHELGHIFLAKIINNWYFVSSWKSPKVLSEQYNMEIDSFLNRLIDCFVDYNLSKFKDFYSAYIIHMYNLNYVLNPENNISAFIFYYLKAYIDFNYILKPEDINRDIDKMQNNLRFIKNTIIKKVRKEKVKLNFRRFQFLDNQLNKFKIIKDYRDSFKIINFFYDTLKILHFWTIKDLKYSFQIYFGIDFEKQTLSL